ncbi:MAG: PPC domain-containing protein [Deltaproteobacteria bacterium]|nr:PPC domain-containing protein [Deltaproteobacteria bacterium]
MRKILGVAVLMTLSLTLLTACSNHAPALVPIGNKTIETGATLEFEVRAIDDDGDELQFGIEGKPTSADFTQVDGHSASFSWTPLASDAGPDGRGQEFTVTFKATDGIDTASETIIVTVTLGGAGTGSPVFVTPSDHTLDLDRASTIKFNIEVRDPDSSSVNLVMVQGFDGADFQTSSGSKLASFRWTPSEAQIADRPVWGFRVSADDHANPEVFQDVTILLKGGQQKCEGTPPSVTHNELPDQRGPGDYSVTVTASDAESSIGGVALYYLFKNVEGASDSFAKMAMTNAGGDSYQASIPNPGLSGEETAIVNYYICAVDEDDADGTACDLRSCAPEEGRFSFTAYASGSSTCSDDVMEENDSFGGAAVIEDGNFNELKICPSNEDWYLLQMPANSYLAAGIGFTQANGPLQMDLLDADGSTVLVTPEYLENQVAVYSDVFSMTQDVYLRVRGASAEVENSYELVTIVEDYVPCAADAFEPNDQPNQAGELTPSTYSNLTCCGEPDWYRLDLSQGDSLSVSIDFINDNGDLDLWIFDVDALGDETLGCENALGCSTTEADGEAVDGIAIPANGTYYIAVAPYQGAQNAYSMLVDVQGGGCNDDNLEPNDTPDDATDFWVEDPPFTGRQICSGNVDWYITILDAGETLLLDLTFSHDAGDLDVALYDSAVTPETLQEHELTQAISSDDNEHLEYPVPMYDFYFIRVEGYAGAENNYTISLGVQ